MFYTVLRVAYSGETEVHSVQQFDNLDDAVKRWYAVMDADIHSDSVTYHSCYIINSSGMVEKMGITDRRTAEVDS